MKIYSSSKNDTVLTFRMGLLLSVTIMPQMHDICIEQTFLFGDCTLFHLTRDKWLKNFYCMD